jgi:hypothetical protein
MTIIKDGWEYPEPFRVDDDAVKDALEELETETIASTGVQGISGGFATADIFDHDEHYFDIELKWGIQNDCENVVHTEQYRMDRLTLKIED